MELAYSWDTLPEKTAYIDPLQNFQDHQLYVPPHKVNLGKRMVTIKHFDGKVRSMSQPIAKEEHIQLVNHQTDLAISMIDKLFSISEKK